MEESGELTFAPTKTASMKTIESPPMVIIGASEGEIDPYGAVKKLANNHNNRTVNTLPLLPLHPLRPNCVV